MSRLSTRIESKEHNMSWDRSPLDAVNVIRKQVNGQVVLVLQGGGALGAYQGGVYEALHEAKVEPDWIIGTSIGAINASIIAGNADGDRLDKVKEFWRRMERNALWSALPAWTGVADSLSAWATVTHGIPGFFETNARAFLGAHVPLGTDGAGYYSTAPLRRTLTDLVDFALVNKSAPRLTVGAAHVRTSTMRYFDSRDTEIKVEHIMASGALPPAFPAVGIDGELFWDGGILSNTPTEAIFDDNPRRNSLIFAVHMWNPIGPEPGTIWEVLHRQKDIQYSSRIANHIVRQREAHRLRHVVNELVKCVPDEVRNSALVPTSRPMAARPACMWCGCSRRGSITKATSRTSTSARRAFASAGRPAMPTPAGAGPRRLDRRIRPARCGRAARARSGRRARNDIREAGGRDEIVSTTPTRPNGRLPFRRRRGQACPDCGECRDQDFNVILNATRRRSPARRILPVANPVAAHYIHRAGLLSASGANSPGPYRS
jgi:NTE family protein